MLTIYIDESGSFVSADHSGAWNITAALVIPTLDMKKCKEALRKLKVNSGAKFSSEIKLKHVSETGYLSFLSELSETTCTLYSVATDTGSQTVSEIEIHRNGQAKGIEFHKNKMHHPQGAAGLTKLADQLRILNPQLYLQLTCQIHLISDVVSQCTLYYVQRAPAQLNGFRWRIDEKARGGSNFEKTFRTFTPPLLQAISIDRPQPHLTDCDYSAMKEFLYTKANAPTYLKQTYGVAMNPAGGLNLNKIIWDDMAFVDSKQEIGVQIVDLLATGLRRSLRGEFNDSTSISKALGSLMVGTVDRNGYPVHLMTLSQTESPADTAATKALKKFKLAQNSLLVG